MVGRRCARRGTDDEGWRTVGRSVGRSVGLPSLPAIPLGRGRGSKCGQTMTACGLGDRPTRGRGAADRPGDQPLSANMEGEVKGRGLDGTCGSALKSNCEKMHPVAKPLKRSAAACTDTG